MAGDFTDLINLHVFPTGRRIHAQREVLEIATEREITQLVSMLEANIAADQATRDLELQWAGHDDRKHAPGAPAVDADLDRAVSALSETVNLKLVAFGSGSKMGQAALRIRQRIFPMGMQAITALTYVEQHETVSTLLRLLGPGGELANQVEILRLDDLLERIGDVNERYGKLLRAGDVKDVTHDKIRKAQAVGQRNLLRVVAWILGHYQDDDRDLEARFSLLGPIVRENEVIRVHRRNRRRPTDVDPETGVEIVDPTNPAVIGD